MTKEQAEKAMAQGQKVRHMYFNKDEWMTECKTDKTRYVFEDGCSCSKEEFWDYRPGLRWDIGWESVWEH